MNFAFLQQHESDVLIAGLLANSNSNKTSASEVILARLGFFPLGKKTNLTEEDCEALVNGFRKPRNPEAKAGLEAVLKKLGFVPKARAYQKPGPTKKSALNASEKVVQRLRSDMRACLEVKWDPPKSRLSDTQVLQVATVVLSKVEGIVRQHLFFTPSELTEIRSLRNRASKLPIDFLREFVIQLDALISVFDTEKAYRSPHLHELICDAELRVRRLGTEPKRSNEIPVPDNDQDLFIEIGEQLGLDDKAGLRELEAEAKKQKLKRQNTKNTADAKQTGSDSTTSPAPDAAEGTDGEPVTSEHSPRVRRPTLGKSPMTRPEILRTALSRLRHLNTLFVDTDQAVSLDKLSPVHRGLQGLLVDDLLPIHKVLEDEMYWNDPQSEVAPILNALKDLFVEAENRQGIDPFAWEKPENAILEAEPTSDLETSTGGYLDVNRSVRAKAARRPFQAAKPAKKRKGRDEGGGKESKPGKSKKKP